MIQDYASDNVKKSLKLNIEGLIIENDEIVSESMVLKESVVDSDSIEFVGCISSYFSVQVHGIYTSLKNKHITVTIKTADTAEITIFNGIIDSVELQSNHDYKTITAYDALYTAGNTEVASWYKGLHFPISLGNLRNSLMSYIGLSQVSTTLPNDAITVKKLYDPETLQAIVILKSICQINGVFGIVNRSGLFEYRVPSQGTADESAYPGATLYPPFYPGVSSGGGQQEAEYIAHYGKIDYQEFTVKPVDKLTIRDDEETPGVSYGSGNNDYIIQGNIFAYGQTNATKLLMAQNIYPNISGISFRPFTAGNNGFPWLECGKDSISYHVLDFEESHSQGEYVYTEMVFPIFNREMRGIQHLKDSYRAEGEEFQRKFITDINAQIQLIKRKTDVDMQNYPTKDYLDDNYYDKDYIDAHLPSGGSWSVQSVQTLPAQGDPSVLYLVQGEVVVE